MQKRSLTKAQIQEEYQLVKAAQKNRRRFAVLYERYYEQIFLFVYKKVSDEDVCGDITSQVFLKAMTNLDRYQFKGVPFSAWLYRIAINEANQYFRETKNQRTISMERSQLVDMVEEVAEESSEEAVRKMLEVLQELSPAEVQMIELRFFEKMPFKEIAALFGITENNAKVKMYRLLGKLKKLMGKRYAKV